MMEGDTCNYVIEHFLFFFLSAKGLSPKPVRWGGA